MAIIHDEPSRTFDEYLLLPNLTRKDHIPANVDLKTPLTRHARGETPTLTINIPVTSALMQAVSDDNLAIALARCGGLAFIFPSQSVESQAAMVARVKTHKAGFVVSDSNVAPTAKLSEVLEITARTGHSTVAVTADGTPQGRLEGIITGRDYRPGSHTPDTPVSQLMTPFAALSCGRLGLDLKAANDLIWEKKLNCLPVIDDDRRLHYLVFRKDHDSHLEFALENVDGEKRLIVGAGINSRDHETRVPALVEAGVDILCLNSSDGYSEWQAETIRWVKTKYQGRVPIGAGNVVDGEGFRYLANAGADFVKVGIGGGSICITREQKGIGRGQASAVIEVARARDAYFAETGIYVPICSDGGITHDHHITLALAMGADFVMMGRYFARFDEAPGRKLRLNNVIVKEYWGEGSNRARNWQRYDTGGAGKTELAFEEGVDSYVPYAGKTRDNLDVTLAKIRSTLCNCGVLSIPALQSEGRITLVSALSLHEGGAHDVIQKEKSAGYVPF